MESVDEFEAFKAMAFNNNRRGSQSVPCTPESVKKRLVFRRESSKSERRRSSVKKKQKTEKACNPSSDSAVDEDKMQQQHVCQNNKATDTPESDLANRLSKMTMVEIWQKRQRLQRQSSLGDPEYISSHDSTPPIYDNGLNCQSHLHHVPVNTHHSDSDNNQAAVVYRNTPNLSYFKGKHGRSFSCRDRRHGKKATSKDIDFEPMRPRTASVPSKSHIIRRPDTLTLQNHFSDRALGDDDTSEFYLVRTFSISKKGLINRGDSFKRRKTPMTSNGYLTENDIGNESPGTVDNLSHASSACSLTSNTGPPVYRILMLGSHGVGKSSLLQQFTSSDYLANLQRESFYESDDVLETKFVSILLDGEESTLYIATSTNLEVHTSSGCTFDAYMVVYSVSDHNTYEKAVDSVYDLRHSEKSKTSTIILVANKGDMVRNREVDEKDGKATAVHFNCKYVEASAVMNLNVDDLLAGVVKQIRLTNKRNSSKKKRKTNCVPDEEATNGCIEHAARGIVNKILRKNSPVFRSCDNLLVL